MNRLIIIGNGFDLAHSLKTSYEDFLVWYINQLVKMTIELEMSFDNELFEISLNKKFAKQDLNFERSATIHNLFSDGFIFWDNIVNIEFNKATSHTEQNRRPIRIRIKSQFFAHLISNSKNWTDIEKAYFQSVLAIKIGNNYPNTKIKKLNAEFEIIKKALNDYIKNIDKIFTEQSKYLNYWDLPKGNFFETLLKNESFKRQYFADSPIIKDNALIVNFNYTNIIHSYLNKNGFRDFLDNAQIINIHGNCQSDNIIFGYGDESHPSYQELEDQDDIELLRNMKSFYYGFSKAYSNLMEFIDKEDFVVDIIGHSLGLSDRLLFREIFERENCKKIKLFHRGNKDSYFNKRIALSRHFNDNTNMRNKVMEYSELDVF